MISHTDSLVSSMPAGASNRVRKTYKTPSEQLLSTSNQIINTFMDNKKKKTTIVHGENLKNSVLHAESS